MTRYVVPPSSNQKVFRICAYGLIGLMLICLALSQTRWLDLDDRVSHAVGWSAIGLLISGMVGIYVLIFRESVDKVWRKLSFDVTDQRIIRELEGQPPIEFPLREIKFLGESRVGLIVSAGEPPKSFFVPRAVEGFEQLKLQLSQHCIVSVSENKTSFIPFLPWALTIAVYAFLFTAKTGFVVILAGVGVLLFQGWSIFSTRRLWAKTRSPKLLTWVFLFSWLVLL